MPFQVMQKVLLLYITRLTSQTERGSIQSVTSRVLVLELWSYKMSESRITQFFSSHHLTGNTSPTLKVAYVTTLEQSATRLV